MSKNGETPGMNGPGCIAELRIISLDPGYAITIIQSPASGEAGSYRGSGYNDREAMDLDGRKKSSLLLQSYNNLLRP